MRDRSEETGDRGDDDEEGEHIEVEAEREFCGGEEGLKGTGGFGRGNFKDASILDLNTCVSIESRKKKKKNSTYTWNSWRRIGKVLKKVKIWVKS